MSALLSRGGFAMYWYLLGNQIHVNIFFSTYIIGTTKWPKNNVVSKYW